MGVVGCIDKGANLQDVYGNGTQRAGQAEELRIEVMPCTSCTSGLSTPFRVQNEKE